MGPFITTLIGHFGASTTSTCDPSRTFFGLPVWYKYLPVPAGNGPCDFSKVQLWPPNDLPLIGLAILDDLLRVAGIVAIAFVIYGGISYVTSQGEPDKTKQAMSTILNALIGLAVTIVAVGFISFIGNQLKG